MSVTVKAKASQCVSLTLKQSVTRGQTVDYHLSLTKDEAYELATLLQHEADKLR